MNLGILAAKHFNEKTLKLSGSFSVFIEVAERLGIMQAGRSRSGCATHSTMFSRCRLPQTGPWKEGAPDCCRRHLLQERQQPPKSQFI